MRNNKKYHYTPLEIKNKLKKIGVKKGDLIFVHSNIAFFGKLKSKKNLCEVFLKSIFEVIGNQGTLVVPTFTYSINSKFNKINTPSVCGVFSNYLMSLKAGSRSADPIFSVYSIGKYSKYLTEIKNISNYECFGKNSFFEKFYKLNGKIVNFNDTCAATHIHYFEKLAGVSYRFDKKFKVKIDIKGVIYSKKIIFYCLRNFKKEEARFDKFHDYAIKYKLARQQKLGLGIITYMEIEKLKKLVFKKVKLKNFFIKKV